MPITTEQLALVQRSISQALDARRAFAPRFYQLFRNGMIPIQSKHEWINKKYAPKIINVTSATNAGILTVPATEVPKINVGSYLQLAGDSAVFKVSATTATTITIALAAQNGSMIAAVSGIPLTASTYNVISNPIAQGSVAGNPVFDQGEAIWNAVQTFRYDIDITDEAARTATYDEANEIATQSAAAIDRFYREQNTAFISNPERVVSTSTTKGALGGLAWLQSSNGCIAYTPSTSSATALTVDHLDTVVKQMLEGGSTPRIIVCSTSQQKVISRWQSDRLVVQRDDQTIGTYHRYVLNTFDGSLMEVVLDTNYPANQILVADTECLIRNPMQELELKNGTAPNYDGELYYLIAKVTASWQDAPCGIAMINNLTV
jgi:hypothetical protein